MKNQKKKETKSEEEAILKELQLLGEMRRRHEWVVYSTREAEETEKMEAEIESHARSKNKRHGEK